MKDQGDLIGSVRTSWATTKPHKTRRGTSKAAPAGSTSVSVSTLKSKMRDVTRVLEHAHDLPLDVKFEKERALAGYRQDLEKAQYEKERKRMIKKYHMVRFFERQKATRNLKRVRTRLASATRNTPDHGILEDQVHSAEVDLNYTLYHPLTEKYIGLFPRQETPKPQDMGGTSIPTSALPQESRPAMWKVVESCMKNGTLEALRDGKLRPVTTLPLRPSASTKTRHPSVTRKQQQATKAVYSDTMEIDEHKDQSDGGFFEE
ncbi:MAG: hypothetical protein Q9188_005153 [Gyalolechia gomerana]